MLRLPVLFLLLAGCGGSLVTSDAGLTDAGHLIDAGSFDAGSFDAGIVVVDAGTLTVVRVHYPAGSKTISLRGSRAPLNWNSGALMKSGAEDTWSVAIADLPGTLEFKPLLDDAVWSRGPNYAVEPGRTVDLYPHFVLTQGEVSKRWPAFSSTLLGNTRGVWVYLPPTYLENRLARFPVIYMHDGQNLFDPALAFGGNPWFAQKAIDAAAESGAFAEAIIVGPENTTDRIAEYTPVADPDYGGGKGALYLRMLVEELKPRVDAELRTQADRSHTVILGSSLGGLISAYAGTTHASTFGLVGAMSPSTWWSGKMILNTVSNSTAPRPIRVYVDSGDSGGSNDGATDTAELAKRYRDLGYVDGADLKYVLQNGATHSEVYWAQRLPGALGFLLGPR